MVVKSIVPQRIRAAGGRFLEKLERDQDVWLQVSEEVAGEKVSHAPRDNHPLSNLTDAAKSMHKNRLAENLKPL